MGVLAEYTDSSLLPEFDIYLSGNKIEIICSWSMNAEFLDRSYGIGFCGTEIRSLK